jgi:hypothetical protein
MGGFTAFEPRLFKIAVSFKKCVEADKVGYIPMFLLLSREETTVRVLGITAFTWINKALLACCYFGGGTTDCGKTIFELERRLQRVEAACARPLLSPI